MVHAGIMELTDAELAAGLAGRIAEMLAALQQGPLKGVLLGQAADAAGQAVLAAAFAALRPDDGLLSEEAPDGPERLTRRRTWIVDPLDGTAAYAGGGEDWAVHVALAVDGAPALGAVAGPAGLFRSDAPPDLPPPSGGRPRLVVSRTRAPPAATALAGALDAELVTMSSAGAKVSALLSGTADLYYHAGGQYEWDSCAPAAVARAAGLHASRADGSPLRYNRTDPFLPDLLVCRPELAGSALAALEPFHRT